MVQIIKAPERKPSFGELVGSRLGEGIGSGAKSGMELFIKNILSEKESARDFENKLKLLQQENELKKEIETIKQNKPLNELQQAQRKLAEQKAALYEAKMSFLDRLQNKNQQETDQEPTESKFIPGISKLPEQYDNEPKSRSKSKKTTINKPLAALEDKPPHTDEDIQNAAIFDSTTANIWQKQNDAWLKQKQKQKEEFNTERSYHTGFSKELEKEVNDLRSSIPRKEMALDFSRNAIESGNLGYFSLDKLADITNQDIFRTAKGSQLITAGKENLLNNMGRVSAKAQNIWFEQRLNSMFPKIGQSNEANLTVQEMLEGEVALDHAYIDAFDKLSQQDENNYGFVKKDIKKRAQDSIKPLEKEILKRTTYRMKEIEEQEQGLKTLKNQVGKNVPKGTPLTLAMAKLYKDKYGQNALNFAEKNGYYIPTIEEFTIFQQRPQEFRNKE